MINLKGIQDRHGALPPYAWPGGYTVIYGTRKDEVLCFRCATHNRREVSWYGTHDEGSPEECILCGYPLLPTYRDPDGVRELMADGHGEREGELLIEIHASILSLEWEEDRLRQALCWDASREKVAVMQQRVENVANTLQHLRHRLAEVREGREIPWSEWISCPC